MKTYIIYKISCLDTNITEIYIGSTIDFKSRKSQHKFRCNNINDRNYILPLYKMIRENNGWENWKMSALEQIECEMRIQAHIREQYWIDKNEAKMNSRKAHITEEQKIEQQKIYYTDNAEQINERQKIYNDNNEEKITLKQKQKYDCICGGKYTYGKQIRHTKSKKHIRYIEENEIKFAPE